MTEPHPKNQRPYARPEGYLAPDFWQDPVIHTISSSTQLLALYLLTSPYTTVEGRVTESIGEMTEAVALSPAQIAQGILDLLAIQFLSVQGNGWQIESPHFISSVEEEQQ
jgi:hypothetical protein